MTKINVLFLWIIIATACSRYPADVERALQLSGDNRAELEKVLEHYGKRSEDRLKLKAAYFLIAGMPYHYTVHDARLDSFRTYVNNNKPDDGLYDDYVKKYGPVTGAMEIKPDLYYITSEYLIRNIDFSFKIWKESYWGNYFSFDDFCEEILPYRLSHEPIEDWKEAYYAVFRPIIDTMTVHNPEEICKNLLKYINEKGWTVTTDLDTQGFGALILLQKRYGNCKEQAEFITYMLRSVGIPSGIDIILQNPAYGTQAHFWNYTHNTAGNYTNFDYYEIYSQVKRTHARKYGKVYRQCYAVQKESPAVKYQDQYIPPCGLGDVLLRDVSSEYFPDTDISVRLEPSADFAGKKGLAFLCVFNSKEWIPITCCKPKNGIAKFRYVEPDILYQLRLISETQEVAASKPFILRGNESAQFLDADTIHNQSMTLLRKFRLPFELPKWAHRDIGGKFQGANRPDFKDSVTLYTICESALMTYRDIQLENVGKFKYVRYLSAPGGYNNMAEVCFYSDGKQLHGKVIGTDGYRKFTPNSGDKYTLFDNNPLSFFNAVEAGGAWAGLELDKAYNIDAIRYIFRNDDNNIRPGDTYELLYYGKGQWLPGGTQTADTTLLQYEKAPSNTLYWLRDHTRGKEERPFTYEDGKQVWW